MVERGTIVGITNSEGIQVITDDKPYESHGRTYIRVARMVEREIDRGFSIQKDWVRSEGYEDILRLMTPLPGFESTLANGPDIKPILAELHSQDIQDSSQIVQEIEPAGQPLPNGQVVIAIEPGSYEAGLIAQAYDLKGFKKHVGKTLDALKAYAGNDPEKTEEFIQAYHRGIILKPK